MKTRNATPEVTLNFDYTKFGFQYCYFEYKPETHSQSNTLLYGIVETEIFNSLSNDVKTLKVVLYQGVQQTQHGTGFKVVHQQQ